MQKINIKPPYITLGQFLKFAGWIDHGSLARQFLSSHQVLVNGVVETRRGRKLFPGDQLQVQNETTEFVIQIGDETDERLS